MDNTTISHLPSGHTLQNGRYTITRMIGAGGFGCTYEVSSGNTRYCVKEFFMSQNCTRNQNTGVISIINTSQIDVVNRSKKKFLEEATVLRMMEHPGIVHVVDIFEENGTAYFVMDYIDGLSLQAMVDSNGPLPEDQAVSYILQVANALDFVHRHDRLHLDIKPDNIMIDHYGRAILIDFGASKFIDKSNENNSSSVFQTPGYAPLEQVNGDVTLFGPFTDIYGLGATLYKTLTGVTPLNSPERADGSELTPIPESISNVTRQAVMAALQLNRRKRPQSAQEFINLIAPGQSDELEAEDVVILPDDDSSIDMEIVDVQPDAPSCNPMRQYAQRRKENRTSATKVTIIAVLAVFVFLFLLLIFMMGIH